MCLCLGMYETEIQIKSAQDYTGICYFLHIPKYCKVLLFFILNGPLKLGKTLIVDECSSKITANINSLLNKSP